MAALSPVRKAPWPSGGEAPWRWARRDSSALDGMEGSLAVNATSRYEGWRAVAGVATGIAVGTMLARPPTTSVTVVASGTNYMYADGAYYEQVYYGGEVSYQVVNAPAGVVISTLPGGCTTVVMQGASVHQCGPTYYQRVSAGYQVVVF